MSPDIPTAKELVAKGKTKTLSTTETEGVLLMEFRDDATAFDGKKHELLDRKGEVNNAFNGFVLEQLNKKGIPNHLVRVVSKTSSLVKSLEMLPVECVIRNRSTGSLCRRLGVEEGLHFNPPMVEFFYKSDELGDPLINLDHMLAFGWAREHEVQQMRETALKVNEVMREMLASTPVALIDFKLEFGRSGDELLLGDEVTPDGCRFWHDDGRKLDKDRFRQGLGGVIESYIEIAQLLGVSVSS